MELIFLLMLPMILLLGAVTTYTDIKYGKIRNRWIVYGCLYALAIILLSFFWYKLGGLDTTIQRNGDFSFFIETFINFVFALFIGILLWVNGGWCAADAKLFTTFALLTPVFIYTDGYVRYFPSIAILINTFAIVFVICVFELLRKSNKYFFKALKSLIINPKQILLASSLIFILSWFIKVIFSALGINEGILELLLVLLLVMQLFRYVAQKLDKKILFVIIFLVLLRLVFDPSVFTISFLKHFSVIILFFVFVRLFLQELADEVFSERVDIERLEEGMVLSSSIVKDKNDKKYSVKEPSKEADILITAEPQGLEKTEVEKIKDYYNKGALNFNKIKITSHTCFGPYIFMGTLIAILLGGHIVHFILTIV